MKNHLLKKNILLGIDRNKINKAQQFQIKKFPNEMIYAMLDYFEPGSNDEEVISYNFVLPELNFKAMIIMLYNTQCPSGKEWLNKKYDKIGLCRDVKGFCTDTKLLQLISPTNKSKHITF